MTRPGAVHLIIFPRLGTRRLHDANAAMDARQGRAERRLAQAEAVEQVANQLNAVKSKVLHDAQTARTVGAPPPPSLGLVVVVVRAAAQGRSDPH